MQLKSSMVAPEFGEVNVHRNGRDLQIDLTILMEPQGDAREGWQTGVALDASVSMQRDYGRMVQGKLPPDKLAEFEKLGWVTHRVTDKKKVVSYKKEAREYGLRTGDLKRTPNVIQPEAR